jgi:hypothetical protein
MSMLTRLLAFSFLAGMTLLIPANFGSSQDDPALPPPQFKLAPGDNADDDIPKDYEVETRGPVHEAFAQPYQAKPETPMAVDKAPPPPIKELPPEQRPDNPNFDWIPGYWAWDADRSDYIWVSGMFRDAPPGRRWVPGHWVNSPEGWRWVSGFWAAENQQNLQYAPEPPAPLEDGPATAPPDENSTYIPGNWMYVPEEQRFAWRPGYWAPFRDNQVWVNPQYYWTPNGYLYNQGYWDCVPEARGMLFAPAFFPTPLWNNPGWFYRPSFGVSLNFFFGSGFWRPGCNNFFFGNFYGPRYAGLGFRPWWGGGFNPLYNYCRWQNRGNPQWGPQQQALFNARMAGKAPLPPANFAQQRAMIAKGMGLNPGVAAVTPVKAFTPPGGKMVPNKNLAGQNLQIKTAQDVIKARASVEGIEKGPKGAAAGPGPKTAALNLPPSPPRLTPGGVKGPASPPIASGPNSGKGPTNPNAATPGGKGPLASGPANNLTSPPGGKGPAGGPTASIPGGGKAPAAGGSAGAPNTPSVPGGKNPVAGGPTSPLIGKGPGAAATIPPTAGNGPTALAPMPTPVTPKGPTKGPATVGNLPQPGGPKLPANPLPVNPPATLPKIGNADLGNAGKPPVATQPPGGLRVPTPPANKPPVVAPAPQVKPPTIVNAPPTQLPVTPKSPAIASPRIINTPNPGPIVPNVSTPAPNARPPQIATPNIAAPRAVAPQVLVPPSPRPIPQIAPVAPRISAPPAAPRAMPAPNFGGAPRMAAPAAPRMSAPSMSAPRGGGGIPGGGARGGKR